MAKDAKGHGSEARSGHEHAIAVDTVKNPLKGLFLGGPSAGQAESNLRGKFGYSDKEISGLKGSGDPRYEDIVARNPSLGKSQISGGQPVESDTHAAATLAGGPKSAAVNTHPAMASVAPSANHPGLGERGGNVNYNSAPPRQFKFKEDTSRATEKKRNNWG